eukprot:3933131-Rhodomonas_salina.1
MSYAFRSPAILPVSQNHAINSSLATQHARRTRQRGTKKESGRRGVGGRVTVIASKHKHLAAGCQCQRVVSRRRPVPSCQLRPCPRGDVVHPEVVKTSCVRATPEAFSDGWVPSPLQLYTNATHPAYWHIQPTTRRHTQASNSACTAAVPLFHTTPLNPIAQRP